MRLQLCIKMHGGGGDSGGSGPETRLRYSWCPWNTEQRIQPWDSCLKSDSVPAQAPQPWTLLPAPAGTDLAQEELLICNSGKETGTFRRSVRILLITMICSKAWEEFCLFSPTHWPIPGSHPATAQIKDIILPQGALKAHRSTLQFSLWPSWIPSLLPHNHLLLQAEHHRRINPELLHFPAKIISQQTCYKPSTPHLVGHITVHQPGHILPASGSAPLHSSWTKSRICLWKKPSSTAHSCASPQTFPTGTAGMPRMRAGEGFNSSWAVSRLTRASAGGIGTKTETRYKINIPELDFLKKILLSYSSTSNFYWIHFLLRICALKPVRIIWEEYKFHVQFSLQTSFRRKSKKHFLIKPTPHPLPPPMEPKWEGGNWSPCSTGAVGSYGERCSIWNYGEGDTWSPLCHAWRQSLGLLHIEKSCEEGEF